MLFVGEKYGYLSLPKPMVSRKPLYLYTWECFYSEFKLCSCCLLLPLQLPMIDMTKKKAIKCWLFRIVILSSGLDVAHSLVICVRFEGLREYVTDLMINKKL